MSNSIINRCNDIKNGSSLTQAGLSLLSYYNDSRFISWFYDEYLPNLQPTNRMLLRTDFNDIDRNLICTAHSIYMNRRTADRRNSTTNH